MNRAQEIEPQNAYRYASRAYIRDAMGDLEGAIADYQIAIKIDPEDAVAHNNLGMLEEKRGHHQQAKVLYDFADKLAKEFPEGMHPETEKPKNIQKEIDKDAREKSLISEAGNIFRSRSAFREFLTFIRNGFK